LDTKLSFEGSKQSTK